MALTAFVFVAAYGALLLLALVVHPRFGLFAYLLAFYGYPPSRWWGEYIPDLRWSLIAAGATLLACMIRPNRSVLPSWRSQPIVVLLVLFIAWLWIQNLWALDPVAHREFCILYTKYLLLFYLMSQILDSEQELYRFSVAHVIGSFYFGWLALSLHAGGRFESVGSPGLDDANILAAHMVTSLMFAGLLLFRANGLARIMLISMIPFILNTIILTQSRSAFLALLAGGLAVFWYKPTQHRMAFYVLAALAVLLFGVLAHGYFWDRMSTLTSAAQPEEIDNSAASRLELAKSQLRMWTEAPILGNGHRGTAVLSPHYLDDQYLTGAGENRARSSHNTVLTLLVEQGVVGTFIFAFIVLWALRTLMRLNKSKHQELGIYRAAVGGSLAALFVSGQFVDLLKVETLIWSIVLLAQLRQLATATVQRQSPRGAQPTIAHQTH